VNDDAASSESEQTSERKPAVANVLASDQVALNVGSNHGVKLGQRYLIYELSRYDVTDPATGDSLGKVEIPKGTGRIASVQPYVSVLESDTELSGGLKGIDAAMMLGAGEYTNPARKAPFRTPRVGDSAKQLY
jgi:hypothetical protein